MDSCLFFEGNGKITQYAGGWSDALAQGAIVAGKSVKETTEKQPKKQIQQPKKQESQKLSYKHKYALENLPKQIEKLSQEIAETESKLNDADLFMKNPEQFSKLTEQLQKLQNAKNDKEDELLEAEILLEEIENN